jgi:drug/metabolite transporter (DMT)-like permease
VSLLAIGLCIVCQLLIVVGQLLLKHAVGSQSNHKRPHPVRNFVLAIGCLSIWFFLWLGLMGRWDLSKLFPFEGLNPAMMAIGAWIVLKEKLPLTAWIGLILVCAGIAIVSGS